MTFYAVRNGRNIGIFKTWNECQKSIYKFKKAQYKKFDTFQEANDYMNNNIVINDDFNDCVNVYTDGCCYNNGKSNSKGSYAIYFDDNDERNEAKIINKKNITNNIAELTAIYKTLKKIDKNIKTIIHTDSMYCITVLSKSLDDIDEETANFKLLNKCLKLLKKNNNVKFHHVNSHTNNNDIHSIKNNIVDVMAKSCFS